MTDQHFRCSSHDEECQAIAREGLQLYNRYVQMKRLLARSVVNMRVHPRYLSKDGLLDYTQFVVSEMAKSF
eukprot:SAG31_NODE_38414_length_296_cov_0.934010_1_plen_70_part_10